MFQASRSNMETLYADQKVYLTDSLDNRLLTHDSDDLFENQFEQDESEDEENTKKQAEREGAEKFREGTENRQQQDQAGRAFKGDNEAADRNKHGEGTSGESLDHHGLLTKRVSIQMSSISLYTWLSVSFVPWPTLRPYLLNSFLLFLEINRNIQYCTRLSGAQRKHSMHVQQQFV